MDWIYLAQVRSSVGLLWKRQGFLGLNERRDISWLTELVSASQEVFCTAGLEHWEVLHNIWNRDLRDSVQKVTIALLFTSISDKKEVSEYFCGVTYWRAVM
jgi:hypothetical protein